MESDAISLISDGGMVVLAIAVLVTGVIALHRRWLVVGWVYDELRQDHADLKDTQADSNQATRELIATVAHLTDEVRELRREVRSP